MSSWFKNRVHVGNLSPCIHPGFFLGVDANSNIQRACSIKIKCVSFWSTFGMTYFLMRWHVNTYKISWKTKMWFVGKLKRIGEFSINGKNKMCSYMDWPLQSKFSVLYFQLLGCWTSIWLFWIREQYVWCCTLRCFFSSLWNYC